VAVGIVPDPLVVPPLLHDASSVASATNVVGIRDLVITHLPFGKLARGQRIASDKNQRAERDKRKNLRGFRHMADHTIGASVTTLESKATLRTNDAMLETAMRLKDSKRSMTAIPLRSGGSDHPSADANGVA
jgi:hypothetical protein